MVRAHGCHLAVVGVDPSDFSVFAEDDAQAAGRVGIAAYDLARLGLAVSRRERRAEENRWVDERVELSGSAWAHHLRRAANAVLQFR
jgi:hypothetical protein